MEFTFALSVGVLTTAGIYLMLRAQTFPVILGLTLLSYAVNLFLFASGRLTVNGAAIVGHSEQLAHGPDCCFQAGQFTIFALHADLA